jgi:hypothetical protein
MIDEFKTLTAMAQAVNYQPTRYEAALRDEVSRLAVRVAEADRLLRRALYQSARVHADFAYEIGDWLNNKGAADREAGSL